MLKLRFFSLPFAFFLLFTSATFAENAEQRSAQGASALQFRILAVQDASDSAEARAVQLAQSPENADAWTVVLSADEQVDGVKGATWIPVDPAQEDSVTARNVTRPSQAQEVKGLATPRIDVLTLDLVDIYNVDGDDLAQVNDSFNNMMTPEIVFEMTPDGAEQMRALTTKYEGRQMGVVMNERLHSAPNINEPIGKNGSLTFGYCLSEDDYQRIQKEVDLLLDELQAAGVKIGRDRRERLPFFPSFGSSPLFLAFAVLSAFLVLGGFVGLIVWLLWIALRRPSPNGAATSANFNASNNFININNPADINNSINFSDSTQFNDSVKRND